MILDLIVIGAAITVAPLHNTVFILLLSTDRGVRKGLAFILAWLAGMVLVIAIVVLATGGKPLAPRSAPSTAALAVKLALGAAMVFYGEHRRRRGPRPPRSPKWMARLENISVWTAAGLGAFMQPWGTVAAGADVVLQAHVSSVASYLALMGYCLLATASLLAMELYATFKPVAAASRLGAIRTWINGHQDQAVVVLSLALGLWLVSRSIFQLVG